MSDGAVVGRAATRRVRTGDAVVGSHSALPYVVLAAIALAAWAS
jgi:hypothetical protein